MVKKVVIYTSEVSPNRQVKPQTNKMLAVCSGLKIVPIVVDISLDENAAQKEFLRNNSKSTNALSLPQIFADDVYVGDFDTFDLLNEDGLLKEQLL